jgi:hypothetical protein
MRPKNSNGAQWYKHISANNDIDHKSQHQHQDSNINQLQPNSYRRSKVPHHLVSPPRPSTADTHTNPISGDSYSQTGFNISSTKPSPSNPLGNPPLPGWTASGGLNWVGFLTSQFNKSTILTYNFAYGGATTAADLVAPYQPTVLSLVDQVAQFSGSIASHPSYAPWTAADTLVGVWIGVNDVGNSYWTANETVLLGKIMDRYFAQLQIVYDAGARNFVLLSVPRRLSLFHANLHDALKLTNFQQSTRPR